MSQEGPIDILGTFPQIPTEFVADIGSAIPILNILNILGTTQLAGINPLHTTGAGNTITIINQLSQAAAVSAANIAGLASFSSADFAVDPNGFVTLGGTSSAVEAIAMQTGTTPVVATILGLVTFNGAVVAAGTNPVRTDGTGPNTMALEVQITQAIVATNATNIGLSAFDSAAFDVDANGFVQLNGGGIAITSINVDANTAPGTDPVVATATGQVTITGGQVATGTIGANVIRTDSLAANTFTIEIQRSTAVAATDSTKNGVSHFDSNNFSVDTNGFVTLTGLAGNYTNVTSGMSPYTVLATDSYLSVDSSGGAVTLRFPNAPTAKRQWIVKDRTGNAATNNISVTTVGGAVTFDGVTTYTANSNYQSINLLANATPTYEVY